MSALGLKTACVEWSKSVHKQTGYGKKGMATGGWIPAHRWAWEKAYGPIPNDMCVCHKCDNRRCVALEHLFLGTKKQNSEDMVAKGRSGKGSKNSQSKLTEETPIYIMARLLKGGERQKDIASSFGVSQSNVSLIWLGERWGHLFKDTQEEIQQ